MLQDGKFGHGFASAGVTQAFAGSIDGIDDGQRFSPKRILAAAVLGGTTSSITGGKFANGAVTGAFSRAFNDENHAQAEARAQKESRVLSYEEYLQEIEDGGAKIGSLSSADKKLAKSLMADEIFQTEAKRIYSEAVASGRETQGIRIYKVNGDHYFLDTFTGSPCSNGSATCMIPPPIIPYRNWELTLTWLPHPGGTNLPSSSDYISNSYNGSIGTIWYGEGKATYYRGERR